MYPIYAVSGLTPPLAKQSPNLMPQARHADLSDTVQFSGKKHRVRKALGIGALAIVIPSSVAVTWAETTAQVSPTGLVYHYVTGNGEPIELNFTELDLTGVEQYKYFPNLQQMAETMERQGLDHQTVDQNFGYVLGKGDEFSVGGISLKLRGELVIKDGKWKLENGVLTGNPNYFEYYPADHRSFMGDAATWFGEQLPGQPYWINFKGSQPVPLLSGALNQ